MRDLTSCRGYMDSAADSSRSVRISCRTAAQSGYLPVILATILVVLSLAVLMLGPYMHESDQASFLQGGVDLARGRFADGLAAYNFDKQYISYALLGGLFRQLHQPFSPDAVVFAANTASFSLFWASWLLVSRRVQPQLGLAVVLPLLLAPALIEHSPFFATAFVSGGSLVLAFECFTRIRAPRRRRVIVAILVFCAVGARTDAVLALPLIALLNPQRRTVAGVLKSIDTWLLPLVALAAALPGRLLFTGAPQDFIPAPLRPSAILAFTVFGLGGALLLMIVCLTAVVSSRRSPQRTLNLLIAAALLLPALFYLPQLMSTRYYVLSIVGLYLFVASPAGSEFLREWFQRAFWGNVSRGALVGAAVIPMFVGISLPDLRHPGLSLSQPSRFPSADGVLPMGSYWSYLVSVRTQHGFVDHNEAVWASVSAGSLETDATGLVPAVHTTMNSYLMLSAALQDRKVKFYLLGQSALPPFFYVDSRSLTRAGFNFEASDDQARLLLTTTAFEAASPVSWEGITLYRGTLGAPNATANLYTALNDIFRGTEFRLHSLVAGPTGVVGLHASLGAEPKKIAVACGEPCSCSLRRAPGSSAGGGPVNPVSANGWHLCSVDKASSADEIDVSIRPGATVTFAQAVFPDWASVPRN